MYLRNSNSFRQMARLAGVSESTITRRIRKIIKRLTDGRYITCLRHQHRLSRAELEVARYHFLCGLSLKKIAERLHCSVWTVRKTVKRLEQLTDVMEIQNKYKILTPKS
jgi:DNA-binding CsgD family transcriptional regulator